MSHTLVVLSPALHFLIQMEARGCIIYWPLLNSLTVILSMFWVCCVTMMICLMEVSGQRFFAFFFLRVGVTFLLWRVMQVVGVYNSVQSTCMTS